MIDAIIRSAANEKLFHALSFAELPGVPSTVKEIEPAIAAGADINGILEEGCTPLNYAIQSGMGSPKAVKVLLELGANPSQRDANGWTPWALCIDKMETPCVADRMKKIADLLSEFGADRNDERVLMMKRAVIERNQDGLLQLFAEGIDINSPMICPLYHAVIQHDAEMVRFLLKQGADPEGNDPQHTCLMSAVQHNQPDIIKILLEAGAGPTRLWGGLPGFTLVFLAKDNGHKELAKWLARLFPDQAESSRAIKKINPKLRPLAKAGTHGCNFDLDNQAIIQRLDRWDLLYGIEISDIDTDKVTVRFLSLPEPLDRLVSEIHNFCPDVIDQGFGCLDDMVATRARDGLEIDPEWARLIDGVDLSQPDAGLILLERSLRDTRTVALWWD